MNTKICEHCGREFQRPKRKNDPRLLSITLWRRQKYCSRSCCASDAPYQAEQSTIALASGHGKWMLGRKASIETRAKIAKSQIGHGRSGWKVSDAGRLNMSMARRGEKSHLWKGGVTAKNTALRMTFEYKEWRKAVFARDNYTCVHCGLRGGRLHADHIKPFALFPESRLGLANGRTLCVPCHKATPTYLKSGARLVEAFYPGVHIVEVAA